MVLPDNEADSTALPFFCCNQCREINLEPCTVFLQRGSRPTLVLHHQKMTFRLRRCAFPRESTARAYHRWRRSPTVSTIWTVMRSTRPTSRSLFGMFLSVATLDRGSLHVASLVCHKEPSVSCWLSLSHGTSCRRRAESHIVECTSGLWSRQAPGVLDETQHRMVRVTRNIL